MNLQERYNEMKREQHTICNAVGCNKLVEHKLKCLITYPNKKEGIHTVYLCHSCFLNQKLIDYKKEEVDKQ